MTGSEQILNNVTANMKICNLCSNTLVVVCFKTTDIDNFKLCLHLLKTFMTIFGKKAVHVLFARYITTLEGQHKIEINKIVKILPLKILKRSLQ